jgi:hypothetical protein
MLRLAGPCAKVCRPRAAVSIHPQGSPHCTQGLLKADLTDRIRLLSEGSLVGQYISHLGGLALDHIPAPDAKAASLVDCAYPQVQPRRFTGAGAAALTPALRREGARQFRPWRP